MFAKTLRSLLLLIFALLSTASLPAAAQTANAVYSQASRSVGIVVVSTFDGQIVGSGSAVTVAPQTMVTNRHVLLPGHRYDVYINGNLLEAQMTNCDSAQDLCLIAVRNLEARPVEFGDPGKLSVGDVVYTIGAPNEIGNIVGVSAITKQKTYSPPQVSLSNGLITALRPVEDGKIIQTNAAISPGSSGGGLFDAGGRLVGITTFAMRNGQDLNMALPVNWVERLGVSGAQHPAPAPQTQAASVPDPAIVATASSTLVSTPDRIESPSAPTTLRPAKQIAPPHPGFATRYAWVLIPLALLSFYLLRRRRRQEDIDDIPLTPSINPALQPFMAAAEQELDQNRPDLTLWNRVTADSKGNMEAARRSYIARRAARLLSAEKDRQWAAAARNDTPH